MDEAPRSVGEDAAGGLAAAAGLQAFGPDVEKAVILIVKLIDPEAERDEKAVELADQADGGPIIAVLGEVVAVRQLQAVLGRQFVIGGEDEQVLVFEDEGVAVDNFGEIKADVAQANGGG